MLGAVAWQNLVWLGGYAVVLRWALGAWRETWLVFLATWALAPVLLHGLVTGSDIIANSLTVLAFLVLAIYPPARLGGSGAVWRCPVMAGEFRVSSAAGVLCVGCSRGLGQCDREDPGRAGCLRRRDLAVLAL